MIWSAMQPSICLPSIGFLGVYKALGELSGQNFVLTEDIVCRSVGALLDAMLD